MHDSVYACIYGLVENFLEEKTGSTLLLSLSLSSTILISSCVYVELLS